MDEETKHRKKKPSGTSKSRARSDHKHEYEPCILKVVLCFTWGERCKICGRTRHKWNLARGRELRKPLSYGKAAVGLDDYLSVAEMKKKFPGVCVYEEFWENHEYKTKEIFK